MYTPRPSSKYKKAYKKLSQSGNRDDLEKLDKIIDILKSGEQLGSVYKDHELRGRLSGVRECHIRGDLLLMYRKEEAVLILVLISVGSHAELFGK